MSETIEARFRNAVALQRANGDAEAESMYREILTEAPGLLIARDNLCLALLAQGKYAEGFPLYDVRFEREVRRVPRPSLSYPEWRGEPLGGKSLLIWFEQGFGDQIMFARFVPLLAALGARVTLLTSPALARLFAHFPATIVAAEGKVELPKHDFWTMPGSIPGRLGITLEALPASPYLRSRRGGSGLGVMVQGSAHPDPNRSLDPEAAAAVLRLPGAVSLAPEATGAQDFQDTADIIAGLERVVTVDTSVAHLSAAMGKPTTILLPWLADWRWLRGRSDSPWYPTAQLVRQPRPGDWASILKQVAEFA